MSRHLINEYLAELEAKDDLHEEIEDKLRKGYPRGNIVLSDDVTTVLYQDGGEGLRADIHADDDSETFALRGVFLDCGLRPPLDTDGGGLKQGNLGGVAP